MTLPLPDAALSQHVICQICDQPNESGIGFERICHHCWFDLSAGTKRRWDRETRKGRYAPSAAFINDMRQELGNDQMNCNPG
jgi:hypothetical protein